MHAIKLAATCLIALLLGACATVSSNYGNSRADQKGLAYYLPKGLIKVELIETGGKFDVSISGPTMVADREFRLHADLRKAALSDNTVEIQVNPFTQLLETADVRSIGRAGEIIENLYNARPTAAYDQGAFRDDGVPVTILVALYEPDDLPQAGQDVSKAMMNYIERICGDGEGNIRSYGSPRCALWEQLDVYRPDVVKLSIDGPFGGTTNNMNLGKCARGLCYRPLVPVKVRSEIGGVYINEDYFMVPDTTTVSYYTLPSGMFATQEYSLTFDQGVLWQVEQVQESEVLGFTRLPTEILREVIAAPVDAITGRRSGTGAPISGEEERQASGALDQSRMKEKTGESPFNKKRTFSIGRRVIGGAPQYRDQGATRNEYEQYLQQQRQSQYQSAPPPQQQQQQQQQSAPPPPPTRVIIEHVLPQPQPSGQPQP